MRILKARKKERASGCYNVICEDKRKRHISKRDPSTAVKGNERKKITNDMKRRIRLSESQHK